MIFSAEKGQSSSPFQWSSPVIIDSLVSAIFSAGFSGTLCRCWMAVTALPIQNTGKEERDIKAEITLLMYSSHHVSKHLLFWTWKILCADGGYMSDVMCLQS